MRSRPQSERGAWASPATRRSRRSPCSPASRHPARRPPRVVEEVLRSNFPASRSSAPTTLAALFDRLAGLGIAGGAVYDALVGAVSVAEGISLVTRDTRAVEVYRALDVDFELID